MQHTNLLKIMSFFIKIVLGRSCIKWCCGRKKNHRQSSCEWLMQWTFGLKQKNSLHVSLKRKITKHRDVLEKPAEVQILRYRFRMCWVKPRFVCMYVYIDIGMCICVYIYTHTEVAYCTTHLLVDSMPVTSSSFSILCPTLCTVRDLRVPQVEWWSLMLLATLKDWDF